MLPDLKIAMAQLNPVVGDLEYNKAKIIDFIDKTDDQTDLIVFPELAICGYIPQDMLKRRCFIEPVEVAIQNICRATKNRDTGILLPCPISKDGKTYNGTHLIHHGKIIGTTLKHHLPNYGVFDEKRYFKPGPLPAPLDFKDHKLGVLICEDLWHMDVGIHLKDQGADILIVPNGSPFSEEKDGTRKYYAKLRATETSLPVIYVNQVGGQDELVFDGGSFVMDAEGQITRQLPYFEEALSVKNEIEAIPEQNTLIWNALVTGTRDYITKNGFSKVLLGLSGGIDSAMVAAIAVDALGAENVHTIMMLSRFTSDESLEDAKECAENLGCSYEIIEIEKPLKAFEETIDGLKGLAHENIQSRIRGTILMAKSNATGSLLLATGNKSEMACGYATLYGDMNGAFNPLKDVYKTKVFALATWRNTLSTVIPERIISKPPSAELRDNQKDEDSLPPYDVLDDILQGLIEDQVGMKELISYGYDEALVIRIWEMLKQAEYKRFQSPPGPKVTNKAFGTDRRVPMTNGFWRNLKSA